MGSREERKQEPGVNNGRTARALLLVLSDRWQSCQANNHGTEVTVYPERLCQELGQSEMPARIEKHCPRLKGDGQTLKLRWPPFLRKIFKKPMKPKGSESKRPYFQNHVSELEVHQRCVVVLVLICMKSCGSLHKLCWLWI